MIVTIYFYLLLPHPSLLTYYRIDAARAGGQVQQCERGQPGGGAGAVRGDGGRPNRVRGHGQGAR